jgi:alpha-mannosidase
VSLGEQGQETQVVYCADVAHGGVAVLLCGVDEMIDFYVQRTAREPGYKINLELDAYTFEDWLRDPSPVVEALRSAIRDGRVEMVNGAYTQPMSETIGLESNIRQLQWGKRLAQAALGVEIKTYLIQEHAFHTALPQILNQLGYKSLILRTRWPIWGQHKRYSHDAFYWQGCDGSTILAVPAYQFMQFGYVPYEIPSLHSWIERNGTARRGEPLEEADIQRWLDAAADEGISYPLATRVPDIINSKVLTDRTVRMINDNPRLCFVTLAEHARWVEPLATEVVAIPPDDMDTTLPFGLLGDLLYIGCKQVETLLLTAEKLSTVAYLLAGRKVANAANMNLGGGQNFEDDLRFAWRKLMQAQQHDIWVCGPASTYGYTLADRGHQWLKIAEEIGNEIVQESLVQILGAIQWTPPAEGALPILVVNPLSWSRSEVVQAELIFAKGERTALAVVDGTGAPVAFQPVEVERYADGSLRRVVVAFWAEDTPGIGYRLYYATPDEAPPAPTDLRLTTGGVANRYLDVALGDTGITRIHYRSPGDAAGKAVKVVTREAAYLRALEGDKGRWIDTRDDKATVELVEHGPVYARYRVSGRTPIFDYSKLITVYQGTPRIEIEETVNVADFPYIGHYTGGDERTQSPGGGWHKAGWHTDCFIEEEKLRTVVPVNIEGGTVRRNVVYAPSETARAYFSAYDWADVSDDEKGLALVNFGNARYCYDQETAELSLVLGYSGLFIYTTSDEFHRMRGEYRFRYALLPHGHYDPAWNNRQALAAQNPLLALRINRWPASRGARPESKLPQTGSFLTLAAPSGVISTLYLEQGQPYLRLYEDAGHAVEATVQIHWPLAQVDRVDLQGNLLEQLEPSDGRLTVHLGPHQIVTLRLGLAQPARTEP